MKLPDGFWEWSSDAQEDWITRFIREACGVAPQLTPKEKQCARLVREGLTQPEIARRMCVSVRTMKVYLHRVYRKMGVRSQVELLGVLTLPINSPLRRQPRKLA
ncbi:MAG TPA: helix-turn-helix transcriptional regulator [Candidatus Angelobacter sp.]|nr:helix-turn-helix transcriptional regulator [Candidatus Angelobacter sp.]